MKTTERFDKAVTKLYNAYHNGELEATNCMMCAVGNICDGDYNWAKYFGYMTDDDNDEEIITEIFQRYETISTELYNKNGYSGEELANVELVFLNKFIGFKSTDKEAQFNGLCAVVEYLCELDNIANVMDYTKLFETENNQPKYQLS